MSQKKAISLLDDVGELRHHAFIDKQQTNGVTK